MLLCHAEAHKYGYATNHGDILHWINNFNKTMDNIREEVAKKVNVVIKNIYRVRKSWKDTKTQKGAYENLEQAKIVCDDAGVDYHVYD